MTTPTSTEGRTERHRPDLQDFCHRCQDWTGTTFRLLSSGHVGRLCERCSTARYGHPYASRQYLVNPYLQPTPDRAEGGRHDLRTR